MIRYKYKYVDVVDSSLSSNLNWRRANVRFDPKCHIETPYSNSLFSAFPSPFLHCMLRSGYRHYFNDIHFASWPFFLGSSVFICFFSIILYIKKFVSITPFLLLVALVFFIYFLLDWFDDVIYESRLNGRYNRKLRSALVCGFTCFLISEVLLFGGFFWAYFDRVYNPGYITGSFCLPSGMENIDYWRWPLVGTFVLVTSGYFANNSYYLLRAGSWAHSVIFGIITIILAFFFLLIQLIEYNGLNLTISDNVYGSFFYLLTGFHGFHVTIGLLFLCEQYSRLMIPVYRHRLWRVYRVNYLYNRERHLGLAFAIIYWHFVDIIWLFLFFNVYVYENISFSDWSNFLLDSVITKECVNEFKNDTTAYLFGANNFILPSNINLFFLNR